MSVMLFWRFYDGDTPRTLVLANGQLSELIGPTLCPSKGSLEQQIARENYYLEPCEMSLPESAKLMGFRVAVSEIWKYCEWMPGFQPPA